MLRKNHPHKDQIQRLIPIRDVRWGREVGWRIAADPTAVAVGDARWGREQWRRTAGGSSRCGGWRDPAATADGSGGSEGEHLDPWMARTARLDPWTRAPMLEVLSVRRGW
jgi:hypothetical protein